MTMQERLFDPPKEVWVKKIWSQMSQEIRHEIVSVLAEIGRSALEPNPPKPKKEVENESHPRNP